MATIQTYAETVTAGLPAGYTERPARMEDLPAAVALFNATARDLIGRDKFIESDFASEWQEPGYDLSQDSRLVFAPDGDLAAYYEMYCAEPYNIAYVWGRTHPAHANRGLASYLLGWAERRALQATLRAPEGAMTSVQGSVIAINAAAGRLFDQHGYENIRTYLRMMIDLNEAPPAPQWPAGIRVRTLRPGVDERAVVAVIQDSFRDHWGFTEHNLDDEVERWIVNTRENPRYDPELVFMAVTEDEHGAEQVAGLSYCTRYISDDPGMGWVQTLGVRRPWRKQGLGLALLLHSFAAFHQRGMPRVGLGVDAESLTGATRLYEKAGMRPVPERQYTLFRKVLRAGVDLSTQSLD
jgi:mycothiol synthase